MLRITLKMCKECGHFDSPKCKDCGTEMEVNLVFGTALCPYGHGKYSIIWEVED